MGAVTQPLTDLTKAQRDDIIALVADVVATDGVQPLNEDAHLALTRCDHRHWLARLQDGSLAGYAQASPQFGTAQLCVRPSARRHGLGTVLLAVSFASGADGVWAFGDLPSAQGLATASGLERRRALLIMARSLEAAPAPLTPPPDVTLRSFIPDADAAAFLAVNAAAFAGHPEQGSFSADDLSARMAESWFDPAGLILAEDSSGLLGFHWTKRHDAETGEVYVIGVHPRASGRGLGTLLLQAGFAHLADAGCSRVILYVDADNTGAVRLYERTGFAVIHCDILYGKAGAHPA